MKKYKLEKKQQKVTLKRPFFPNLLRVFEKCPPLFFICSQIISVSRQYNNTKNAKEVTDKIPFFKVRFWHFFRNSSGLKLLVSFCK